jgi:hypothetical protein
LNRFIYHKATNLTGNNKFVGVARFRVHCLFGTSDGNKFAMYSKLGENALKWDQIVNRMCARHLKLIVTGKIARRGC